MHHGLLSGKRIFISGDAETADTLCKTKNLDLLIGPVWVIQDAKKRNLKIDTKKIIIGHLRITDKATTDQKDKIFIPTQNQKFELK